MSMLNTAKAEPLLCRPKAKLILILNETEQNFDRLPGFGLFQPF
jgi:hypothetical protein